MKKQNLTPEEIKNTQKSIKKHVYDLEQDNLDYIYAYYTSDKWYKVGGNSALFLYHILAPQMGDWQPRLKSDGDYDNKFPTGCISIRDIDMLADRLERLGIKLDEAKTTVFIRAFKLPKPISKKELRQITGKDALKRKSLNETLALERSDPELAAQIRALQKVTYSIAKKMKPIDRELVGEDLLKRNMRLYVIYRDWANNEVQNLSGLKTMLRVVDEMEGYMLIIMENDIMEINDIAAYTVKIEGIRASLRKRIDLSNNLGRVNQTDL